MKIRKRVLILGGGIAGLTVAWRLLEEGIPVTVLEREAEVGGLSRTTKFKGFLFDYSAHRFNSDNPEVIRRFKEVVGTHVIKKQKKTFIHQWNRYLIYPPVGREIINAMPTLLLIRASLEFLIATIKGLFITPQKKSFSEWTRANFGKTLSVHLNEKYAEKIWKRPADELSSDWASTRVGNFKIIDFILAIISFNRYKKVFSSRSHPDGDWFYYSDIGIGYFPQQMRKKIESLGGIVLTNAIVTRINKRENDYEVVCSRNGIRKTLKGEFVVSSIPFDILLHSLSIPIPKTVKKSIESLEYLAVLVVNIIVKKTSIMKASWIYFPESEIVFNYILEFKNWSNKMVKKGMNSISANITCKLGDLTWKMSDKDLIKKTIDDLCKVNAIKRSDYIDGYVERLPYAYPVLDIHYRSKLNKVINFIQSLPHFYLTGRTGKFDYINSDKVMENALQLSDKLIKEIHKLK